MFRFVNKMCSSLSKEMDDIFLDTILSDKVCLSPIIIRDGLKEVIVERLKNRFENVCTHHGFIRQDSIEIVKYSLGQVRTFSLNGDVIFNVMYKAQVCNPAIGSTVSAKVVNMNKFGILAESLGILEIIVPREDLTIVYKVGQDISVNILGKKFELGDTKLSIVGKILQLPESRKVETDADQEVTSEVASDDDDIIEEEDSDDELSIDVEESERDDESSLSDPESDTKSAASSLSVGPDNENDQETGHENDETGREDDED